MSECPRVLLNSFHYFLSVEEKGPFGFLIFIFRYPPIRRLSSSSQFHLRERHTYIRVYV